MVLLQNINTQMRQFHVDHCSPQPLPHSGEISPSALEHTEPLDCIPTLFLKAIPQVIDLHILATITATV